MGGQHLAMRVDVDASAFGLLQQLVEIVQVMAGNQNSLALARGGAARVGVGAPKVSVCAWSRISSTRSSARQPESHAQQLFRGVLRQ